MAVALARRDVDHRAMAQSPKPNLAVVALAVVIALGAVCVVALVVARRAPPAPSVRASAAQGTSDAATGETVAADIARLRGVDLENGLCGIERRARTDLSYALLERDPPGLRGTIAIVAGEVIEIHDEPSGHTWMRISMSGSYPTGDIVVENMGTAGDGVVRGAFVRAYGAPAGSTTYSTTGGGARTVPAFASVAVVPQTLRNCAELEAAGVIRPRDH